MTVKGTVSHVCSFLMMHVRCRKEEPAANSNLTGSLAINKPEVVKCFTKSTKYDKKDFQDFFFN